MTTLNKTNRRDFLKITSMTGGGLLLGFSWFSAEAETPVIVTKANFAGELGFNSYLSIGTDGTITIFSPNPELGQNIMTSFPMIVAEELDADELRDPHAGGVQQFDQRTIAEASRRAGVGLGQQEVHLGDRQVARQRLPRPRCLQLVRRARRQAAIENEVSIEATIAGDRTRDRPRRAAARHHRPHGRLEVRARQRVQVAAPRRRFGQIPQVPGVALERVGRQTAFDHQVRQVGVHRGRGLQ